MDLEDLPTDTYDDPTWTRLRRQLIHGHDLTMAIPVGHALVSIGFTPPPDTPYNAPGLWIGNVFLIESTFPTRLRWSVKYQPWLGRSDSDPNGYHTRAAIIAAAERWWRN